MTYSLGANISPPSLPGDRYLKLAHKSDHRVIISGNIVPYDALGTTFRDTEVVTI